MKPTKEQLDAMDLANTHCSFKISAYAGAGKTSTLKLIGQTLSDKNGLYLAFNKSIAEEAGTKFDNNVEQRWIRKFEQHL